jgi:CheY-like chemotaxis protein
MGTNRKLVEIVLRQEGWQVDSVCNGEEALEALSHQPYDLVLMDCQMPKLDGYQTTRQILRNSLKTGRRAPPVIALTASNQAEDRLRCRAAGMNDFLAKPLNLHHLIEAVRKWLGDSTPGKAAAAASP